MRTTLRIDDDLLRTLKQQAKREDVPLTDVANRVLRLGIKALKAGSAQSTRPFRQRVSDMGVPKFDVSKALDFATQLEDDETLRKLTKSK